MRKLILYTLGLIIVVVLIVLYSTKLLAFGKNWNKIETRCLEKYDMNACSELYQHNQSLYSGAVQEIKLQENIKENSNKQNNIIREIRNKKFPDANLD